MLTISEVAEELKVSTKTVRTWIRNGELKAANLSTTGGSRKPRMRVSRGDLDDFITQRLVPVKTQQRAPKRSLVVPQIV